MIKDVINGISKLRDVYSSIKVEKLSTLLKIESKDVNEILKHSLYSGKLGPNVIFDELNKSLNF